MKHFLPITFLILCITSCKKEDINRSNNSYLERIKSELKDSIIALDYASLDFNGARLAAADSTNLYLVRIPFKQKDIANDFVLLQTNMEGAINRGKIVHMERSLVAYGMGKPKAYSYQGSITIQSLNRATALHSLISDGYIEAFHPESNFRTAVKQPDNMLPEVVVVGYYDGGGVSYSDWAGLLSFFTDSGSGNSGGYYSPLNSGGDGNINSGGGGGNVSPKNGLYQDPVIEPEAEYMYSIPVVQLSKMFKCFDDLPSDGATYSIKLCADIPNNQNPNMSANFSSISAGHTFLTVTKTKGTISVTQSFGFYPSHEPSILNPFVALPSAIKDNGFQEINASIELNIQESQFNTVKQNAMALAAKSYELSDYNCTSYALDVFNSVRANPIQLQPYHVILPGNANPYNPIEGPIEVVIEQSPQMLFLRLQQMKKSSAEAFKIIIDQTHSYHAPISRGECN